MQLVNIQNADIHIGAKTGETFLIFLHNCSFAFMIKKPFVVSNVTVIFICIYGSEITAGFMLVKLQKGWTETHTHSI